MKNIVLNVQNSLVAEAITQALLRQGQFCAECVSIAKADTLSAVCRDINADVLLMEVTYLAASCLERRLEICENVRREASGCKIALLCDENADKNIAEKVKQAKQFGHADAFFYTSVTTAYLCAALDAL